MNLIRKMNKNKPFVIVCQPEDRGIAEKLFDGGAHVISEPVKYILRLKREGGVLSLYESDKLQFWVKE